MPVMRRAQFFTPNAPIPPIYDHYTTTIPRLSLAEHHLRMAEHHLRMAEHHLSTAEHPLRTAGQIWDIKVILTVC
jgi:hypothetical protein